MNRKLMALWIALLVALAFAMPAAASGAEVSAAPLIILHTNDMHGRAAADYGEGVMGYAEIAQYKQDFAAQGASVLLLDAGDAVQGTPLVNLSYGAAAIDFMNAAGYDAMTVGNHEFDWGLDNLLALREQAAFPMLVANITYKAGGEPVFEAHRIFEMPNGMKVGVFGLNTPESLTKANPDKVRGIAIAQGQALYDSAQAQVDALAATGCDLIVCLSHLGIDEESAPNRSLDVLAHVVGIDLMIDAHSHSVIVGEYVGETMLVSTGEYGQNLGKVVFDGRTLTASLIAGVHEDPEVAALVGEVNASVTAQLSTVFAQTEVLLDGERDPGVRTQETNLGDFAADAILWAARQAMGEQVAAAVTNGGGIRTSIQIGDITMNDMKTVFPFGNEVTILTVTGAELLEALEAATYAAPAALGAFPQVAGLAFTVDTTVPYAQGEQYPDSTYFAPLEPGSRVTIESINGEAFDPAQTYMIATNDFTAAGGDTYYAFRYAYATTGYKTGVSLEEALVNYVAEVLGGVVGAEYAAPQGRITIKTE